MMHSCDGDPCWICEENRADEERRLSEEGDDEWLEQFEWCGVHDVAINDLRRMFNQQRIDRDTIRQQQIDLNVKDQTIDELRRQLRWLKPDV